MSLPAGAAGEAPRTDRRGPRHAWLANAGLLALGLALCVVVLGGAEGVLRAWEPAYLVRTRGLHVTSETYGWSLRPAVATRIGGVPVTVNADGYRGPALPPRLSGGPPRVVVLGDSIAFGYGVADDATFAARLAARRFAVANLAVQGYGTCQELIRLEREGLALEPDAVVLGVCLMNDFADTVLPQFLYNGTTPQPWCSVEEGRLVIHTDHLRRAPLARAVVWLGDHSHLFGRAHAAFWGEPGTALLDRPAADTDDPRAHWARRYQRATKDRARVLEVVTAAILRIDDDCRRRGVRLVVALFPGRRDFLETSPWRAGLREAVASAGITTVDMTERFQAAGLRFDQIAIDRVGHLNPRGHELAAQALAERLASSPARDP